MKVSGKKVTLDLCELSEEKILTYIDHSIEFVTEHVPHFIWSVDFVADIKGEGETIKHWVCSYERGKISSVSFFRMREESGDGKWKVVVSLMGESDDLTIYFTNKKDCVALYRMFYYFKFNPAKFEGYVSAITK